MAPNVTKNWKIVMTSYIVYMMSYTDFFGEIRFFLSRLGTTPIFKST